MHWKHKKKQAQLAVAHADAMKISELAQEIETSEPALSNELKTCARNFDYETIRMALQLRIEN
jgi:hypothetical protein